MNDVKQKFLQMVNLDFRSFNGKDVNVELPDEVKDFLEKYQIGGVILFAPNCRDNVGCASYINQLQDTAETKMFISIDQEGGLVTRLGEGTPFPSVAAIGESDNIENCEIMYDVIGKELDALGVNLNFAPVVDINEHIDNPISIRSFSSDKSKVVKFATVAQESLRKHNVIPCLKHFPGQGSNNCDSHFGLPVNNKTLEEMLDTDIYPYLHIKDADMVMLGHVSLPKLDDTLIPGTDLAIPATISEKVINGILVEKLGFDGLVTTDALDMDGIAQFYSEEEVIKLAINAGVHVLLMPFNVTTSEKLSNFIKLIENIEFNEAEVKKIEVAYDKIIKLKKKYGILDFVKTNIENINEIVGCSEHTELERKVTKECVKFVGKINTVKGIKFLGEDYLLNWLRERLGISGNNEDFNTVIFVSNTNCIPEEQIVKLNQLKAEGIQIIHLCLKSHLQANKISANMTVFSYGFVPSFNGPDAEAGGVIRELATALEAVEELKKYIC